jgi:hypothetical protein
MSAKATKAVSLLPKTRKRTITDPEPIETILLMRTLGNIKPKRTRRRTRRKAKRVERRKRKGG